MSRRGPEHKKRKKRGTPPEDIQIIGSSTAIRRAISEALELAETACAVLIEGETGSGKELIARLIHACGRPNQPLVAFNCASIGGALLEAELFGYVKGAFTGATTDKAGLFRKASGGTLFLDEVGELTLETQAGLLRALQEKRIRPVGSTEEVAVDARVIAATHRDLREMVRQGTFREDLYFRLVEGVVQVPALCERRSDIPAIARYYLAHDPEFQRGKRRVLSHDAARELMTYSWPGNVRELRVVLARLVRESRGRYIRAYLVSRVLATCMGKVEPPVPDLTEAIVQAVRQAGESTAAELCARFNLPRTSLLRHLQPPLESGLLARVGSGWQTRYRPGEEATVNATHTATEADQLALISGPQAGGIPPGCDVELARRGNPEHEQVSPLCPTAVHQSFRERELEQQAANEEPIGGEPQGREHDLARLFRFIHDHRNGGAAFEDLMDLLPSRSRNEVKVLLRALKDERKIHPVGRTRAARWFPGPSTSRQSE